MRIHLHLRTATSLMALAAALHASTSYAGPREHGDQGAKEGHGPHGHHGPFAHMKLSPAVADKVKAAWMATHTPPRATMEAKRALSQELAAEVRTGKLDERALGAKQAAIAAAAKSEAPQEAAFLRALHASLTPAERTEFANASREAADRASAPRPERPKGDEGDKARGPRGPMMHLLAKLELAPAQRDQVMTSLKASHDAGRAEHEAMRQAHAARARALADAFARSDFDPAKLPALGVGAPAAAHAEREVQMVRLVLPVLNAEQRSTLADELTRDRHARHGKHRARG